MMPRAPRSTLYRYTALFRSYTYSPLANGDTSSVFSGSLTRAAGENVVDTHVITQGSVSAGSNYNITYIPADQAITAAPPTETADGQTHVYGTPDPTFTYTYS